MQNNTSVIIVAAGNSSRMQGKNKQFLSLGKSSVIGNTMRAFENSPSILEIIIVARECDFSEIELIAKTENILKLKNIVEGGTTRQRSVMNGINSISENAEFIAIHDGARPLITPLMIETVIKDAEIFGSAALGVPVKDTIKVIKNNTIMSTPERSSLYITQTPQVFRKDIYYKGIEYAKINKLDFTDDCQLAEAVGYKVHMTMGEYSNMKITTPEDIKIAELLLMEGKN